MDIPARLLPLNGPPSLLHGGRQKRASVGHGDREPCRKETERWVIDLLSLGLAAGAVAAEAILLC